MVYLKQEEAQLSQREHPRRTVWWNLDPTFSHFGRTPSPTGDRQTDTGPQQIPR